MARSIDTFIPSKHVLADRNYHDVHAASWSCHSTQNACFQVYNNIPLILISLWSHTTSATPPELKALDLYLPLSALPKNNESEHDPMDREALENPGDGKELSMKELGRLKSKKAVAKVQSTGPAGEGEEEELEERRTKRAKSEHDDAGGEDVVMGGL
jgi:hypothetical protein